MFNSSRTAMFNAERATVQYNQRGEMRNPVYGEVRAAVLNGQRTGDKFKSFLNVENCFCSGVQHCEWATVQHCARTTMFHSQWAGFSSSLSRILLIFSLFRFATLYKTQFKNKSAQRFRNKFATLSTLRNATQSTRRLKYTKIHFSTCEQQSEDS